MFLSQSPRASLDVGSAPPPKIAVSSQAGSLAGQAVGSRVVMGLPLLDAARTQRLAQLGLRAGMEVVVLHRTAGRGRVLAIGDTRLALDRRTLEAIPVLVLGDEAQCDQNPDLNAGPATDAGLEAS